MINNKFDLVGRVARDVESNNTANGGIVAKTAIAVYSGKDAQGNPLTEFFNITGFNKTADAMLKWNKGDMVMVTGRLKKNEWTDQQTGQKRSSVDLIVDVTMMLAHPQNAQPQQRVPQGYMNAEQYAAVRSTRPAEQQSSPFDPNNWGNPLGLDDSDLGW